MNLWHVIRDGNAWCAVGPEFDEFAESTVGWGETGRLQKL